MTKAGLTVTVSRKALVGLGTNPAGPIYRHWLKLLAQIDSKAKHKLSNDMVNVRTGNLRSSQGLPFITVVGERIIGTVENKASYAVYVHEGTKPHLIPLGGEGPKILTGWTYDNAPVFTPVVNHPGTKARPWLRDSLKEVIATTAFK